MKIVVGGQINKQEVADLIMKYFTDVTVDIKNDLEASMDMKNNLYDYYFGACNTGGGGALAMAIAILGADKCLTIASPLSVMDEQEIVSNLEKGKIAFGFTPNMAEYSINILSKYLKERSL